MSDDLALSLKQAIVVRADLQLPKGKLAVQVAHASVDAAFASERGALDAWFDGGQKKVVLKVPSRAALFALKKQAEAAGLVTALIRDAGKTVLRPNTVTCLGIGPAEEEQIDSVTGKLQMV